MSAIVDKVEADAKTLAAYVKTKAAVVEGSSTWRRICDAATRAWKLLVSFLGGITRTEWLVIGCVVLLFWWSAPAKQAPQSLMSVSCSKPAPLSPVQHYVKKSTHKRHTN